MISRAEDEVVPVGRVVATELKPSTPHQFYFWTARESPIGIGAIVRVTTSERLVYGVVTDGYAYSDLLTPLDDVIGADGDPSAVGGQPTARTEIRLYAAAVLRQEPAEPLQPVPIGDVFLANDVDVIAALRMDVYTGGERATGIPIGVYHAAGLSAPVYVDADFLLGPEAAHLNISGVSGLATKTSAVEFFLSSIFQTFPAHKGSVAAVCFNVKGPDLCYLDQPGELSEDDLALYARLGLRAEPFGSVRYFAPYKADGVNLNTLRTNRALSGNTEPLVWGLREVLDFAEVLLNRDDIDAKADAFIDFLAARVIGKEYVDETLRREPFRVRSFADLSDFFRAIFDYTEALGRGDVWRTHHLATIRKVRNRLSNISTRSKGLVTDDGVVNDLPWGEFSDRGVLCIDVAGLDPLAQDLVFARVVSKLREHLERRDLGVDHVVVFVDELNKYAPADGPDTYVRKMILDLSERGRYLGLTLFSAQQFRSQVQRRVVGNAGTSIFGRMDSDELATPGYSTVTPATKIKLATLPKGELMVRHPHFTQPIFVRFPRPAVMAGRDGIEQFPPEPDLSLAEAVRRQLQTLDRQLSATDLAGVLEGRREADVRRAVHATRQARPDNVLAFFRSCFGKAVPLEAAPPGRGIPAVKHSSDPYAP
ncbi:MAG: ATP-binding protein [Gemmatimonadales bacterium]|nr:ATP-binding protein [Gemmatimonadales bacterium]